MTFQSVVTKVIIIKVAKVCIPNETTCHRAKEETESRGKKKVQRWGSTQKGKKYLKTKANITKLEKRQTSRTPYSLYGSQRR